MLVLVMKCSVGVYSLLIHAMVRIVSGVFNSVQDATAGHGMAWHGMAWCLHGVCEPSSRVRFLNVRSTYGDRPTRDQSHPKKSDEGG